MNSDDVPSLIDELKLIRRGYGVEARDIVTGPLLTEVCALRETDGLATRRRKVIATLMALVSALPEHLRDVSKAVFGLDGTAKDRYEQRLRAVGHAADRDLRTMQRRANDVLRRVAELAAEGSVVQARARSAHGDLQAQQGPPWHIVKLTTLVGLDLAEAEVFETRRIASHRDGLSEVDHSVTVDPAPGTNDPAAALDVGIHLYRGGTLRSPRWLAANRVGYRVVLPHPLRAGEEHEFFYRIKTSSVFAPRYVCTPKFRCDAFDLTIRFGHARAPRRIWLLESEMPLALNDLLPAREELHVDAAGEVHHEFMGLEPNRSYGIGWDPVPMASGCPP